MFAFLTSFCISFIIYGVFFTYKKHNKRWWKFKKDNHYDLTLQYWKYCQKDDRVCIKMAYDEFYKFYSLTPNAFTFKVEYASWSNYRFVIEYKIYNSNRDQYFTIVPKTKSDFRKIFYLYYESDLKSKESITNLFTQEFLKDYRDRLKSEMDLADQKIEEAKKNILDIQTRL